MSDQHCPTCSQAVPRDVAGVVQARIATRIHAERAAGAAARTIAELQRWIAAKCTIAGCYKSLVGK